MGREKGYEKQNGLSPVSVSRSLSVSHSYTYTMREMCRSKHKASVKCVFPLSWCLTGTSFPVSGACFDSAECRYSGETSKSCRYNRILFSNDKERNSWEFEIVSIYENVDKSAVDISGLYCM